MFKYGENFECVLCERWKGTLRQCMHIAALRLVIIIIIIIVIIIIIIIVVVVVVLIKVF